MSACSVIFAGGGTGGHVYPNIAVFERLRERIPDLHATFICSDRSVDAEALRGVAASIVRIPARPFGLAPWTLARLAANWGRCLRDSRGVLRSRRDAGRAVHVVATGGYVSAPVIQAARVERVAATVISLDAIPGRAARWAARRAAATLSAAAHPPPGWEPIGPIVRRDALPPAAPEGCRRALGLDPSRRTLLVTGGSQGARSVNDFLASFAAHRAESLAGWQVIHQAGADAGASDRLREAYEMAGARALVVELLRPIGPAWGAAEVAVARAGAGSVAEVWASATPTLFLPYPHHRDMHQAANARALVDAGGALLAADQIEGPANARGEAGDALARLLASETDRASMSAALRTLGPADGADQAAQRIAAACADPPESR